VPFTRTRLGDRSFAVASKYVSKEISMQRTLKLVSQGAVVSQPNRNVFSDHLNCPRLSHSLKVSGNMFQSAYLEHAASIVAFGG